MTVRLETSMVRHQSDVVRRDIRMSSGSDVRVGRVGWVTDILWISRCYQGKLEILRLFFLSVMNQLEIINQSVLRMFKLCFVYEGLRKFQCCFSVSFRPSNTRSRGCQSYQRSQKISCLMGPYNTETGNHYIYNHALYQPDLIF